MTIFGKTLSEYVSFARLFLIVTPLVGLLRLGLSLQGVPQSTVQWFSMTAVGSIAVFYFAIRLHTSGFGRYKQLLVLIVLQSFATNAISCLGILLAMVTGVGNIYSAPEFSFGGGSPWVHFAAHLFFATTVGSLLTWIFGSVILTIADMKNWYLYFDVLGKYAVFSGRARRREYWMFTFLSWVIYVALMLLNLAISYVPDIALLGIVPIVVYSFAMLVPSLAVTVRRLHDTSRTGWWLLISLVPLVGGIICLVFLVLSGESGDNEYGSDPKAVTV